MQRSKSAAGFLQTHSPTLHYTFHETIGFFFCAVKFATMQIYLTGVTFRQFYLLSMLSGGTSDFLFTDRETKFGDRLIFWHLSVSHSVHRWSLYYVNSCQAAWSHVPFGGLCVDGSVSRGSLSRGSLSRKVFVGRSGSTHPTGKLSYYILHFKPIHSP